MFSYFYYGKAQYHHYKKQWAKKAISLEKSISIKNTPNYKWFYELGFAYSKLKKWEQAVKPLKLAAENASENVRWQYRYAIALENTNKKSEANDIYDAVFLKNLNNDINLFKYGSLLSGFSRPIKAENYFRKAVELNNSNFEYYSMLADSLNKQKKWWQELEALKSAVKLNTVDAHLAHRLGAAYEKMSNYIEAAKHYKNSVALNEENPIWHYNLGYAYEKAGMNDEAEKSYANALKKQNSETKKIGIAEYHKRRGLWPDVANALEKKRKSNEKNSFFMYSLGMAYDRSYQWEKAEACYKKSSLTKKGDSNIYFRLGFVLEKQSKWSEAAKYYEMAARASERHNSHIFYRLGYCLTQVSSYEKACHAFIMMKPNRNHEKNKINYKIFSTTPWTADECFQRGREYENHGDIKNAIHFLREGLTRKSIYESDWYYQLGYYYFKDKNFQLACEAFIETRIFTKAYGVSLDDHEKSPRQLFSSSYIEYYERLKIKEKHIVFESYHGDSVSCNPLAIFEYIYNKKEFSDYKFIWCLQKNTATPPILMRKKNVIITYRGTDSYLRHLASAKYLINNVSFPDWFIRKKGQLYLNTWHGTPMKYLGKDIKDGFLSHCNVTKNFLHATHIISQNKYTNEILLDRYDASNLASAIIAETGYPRTDITLKASKQQKSDLKKKLGIKENEKVVLYAPTWRGLHGNATFNVEALIKDLGNLNINGSKLLFRGHHMVENLILQHKIPATIVKKDIDTNILLSIVDVLVTDYSSIAFDFLPLNRPIIYYWYDVEEYKKERGLYLNENEIPGKVCSTSESLSQILSEELKDDNRIDYQNYIQKFTPLEDGYATSRVVDLFFHKREQYSPANKKDAKKKIIIYAGAFIPNGICTSTLNMLNALDYNKYAVTLAVDIKSIQGHPERMEMIRKVPANVQIVGALTAPYLDPEEKWVADKLDAYRMFSSDSMRERFLSAYEREFTRLFGHNKFDAIINFEGYNKKWVALFASLKPSKTRKIIFQHNDMKSEFLGRFPYLKCNFELYNNYDKIVSVSKATGDLNKSYFSEILLIDKDKFEYSDNLQNPAETLSKSSQDLDGDYIFNERYTFVTMGRLSPEKDHEKLIHAFSQVNMKHPNTQLLILGDGPLEPMLSSLIKRLKLQDYVLLLGRKDNPFPYLAKSDCFVLSSNHEGQPMVLFEALILKKPIVATDIVGNRGILGNEFGLLVENSTEALAKGLIQQIENSQPNVEFDIDLYQQSAINRFYNLIN